MTIVIIRQRDSFFYGLEYSETITDGSTGDTVRIPSLPPGKNISCRLIAGVGSGKFQTSTSTDQDVIDGNAVWADWPSGSQSGTYTAFVESGVSAVRGISISGDISIEVMS